MLEGTSGRHLVQPPGSSRVTQSTLTRTIFRQLLSVSKEGDLCQRSFTLTVKKKKVFPDVQKAPTVGQFVPIASSYYWSPLKSIWLHLLGTLPSGICTHWWDPSLYDITCAIHVSYFLLAWLARKPCLWECPLLPCFLFFFFLYWTDSTEKI